MMRKIAIRCGAPLVVAVLAVAVLQAAAVIAASAEPAGMPPAIAPPEVTQAPASPAPPAAMEAPTPGDYWVYQTRDEITGMAGATRRRTVTEVTATEITTEVTAEGTNQKQGSMIYDRSWNLIDRGDKRYTTNDGTGIRLPLTVGKTWSSKSNYVVKKTGESWVQSGTSKVTARESMTTSAGTFDTFKIESSITLQSVADPSRIQKHTDTGWYAPAIDHWVRRTYETRLNGHLVENLADTLISYGRRQADTPPPRAEPPSAPPVAMEDPLPGDQWTYEVRDEIRGTVLPDRKYTVTEVTPDGISTVLTAVNSRNPRSLVFDRSWNLIDRGDLKFTPNDGTGIRLPLAVGKTWSYKSNAVRAEKGESFIYSGTSKVVAQETLTTSAGTFETFKIETSTTVQNVANPSTVMKLTNVTWYAPLIDHWVKHTFAARVDEHLTQSTSDTLISYGRRQADAPQSSCPLQSGVLSPVGAGKVVGFMSSEQAVDLTHRTEAERQAKLNPAYINNLRVFVQPDGSSKRSVAIVPETMTVKVGDQVEFAGAYRDASLPCHFMPPLISKVADPAAPAGNVAGSKQ
jgi:hypothetical protein